MMVSGTSSDMSDDLSSDILEGQFGPTELDVLRQDGQVRIIRTRTTGGQLLELSLVSFKTSPIDGLREAHEDVLAGRSMGKAFRDRGLPFKRQVRAVYEADVSVLPPIFQRTFETSGAATVVNVSILAGPEQMAYADILEVYNPAVSWPQSAGQIDADTSKRLEDFAQLLTDSSE